MAADPAGRWYAVVDTAQDQMLYSLVKQCREHVCLISGELNPVLAAALPWVVVLNPLEPLAIEWRSRAKARTGESWRSRPCR